MKKLLALFAAAACVGAANAQVADGDYLILNTMTSKYLNGSNDWGTKASVTKHGQFMTIVSAGDGLYNIDSHYSNGGNSHYLAAGDNTYVDASPAAHTIVEHAEGLYSIMDANGMYLSTDGNVANFNGAELTYENLWTLITKEQYVSIMTENIVEPVDFTAFIPDANFSRNNVDFNLWTGASKMGKGGPNAAKDATAAGMNAERWGGNSTSIDFGTTVEGLPNGKYVLSFQGFYRYNNTTDNTNEIAAAAHADGTEVILANLVANDKVVPFPSVADEDAVATYGKMPFSQTEASEAFTLGCYKQQVNVEVTDGTLEIKVIKHEEDHLGTDWTVIDNLELYLVELAGNEDAIESVAAAQASSRTYDLLGREVANAKGLVIRNGKVMSIK